MLDLALSIFRSVTRGFRLLILTRERRVLLLFLPLFLSSLPLLDRSYTPFVAPTVRLQAWLKRGVKPVYWLDG